MMKALSGSGSGEHNEGGIQNGSARFGLGNKKTS
jgi:hypothetical protein